MTTVRKALNLTALLLLWSCGGDSSTPAGDGGLGQNDGGQTGVNIAGDAGVIPTGDAGDGGGASTGMTDGSVSGIDGAAVMVDETGKARLKGNDGITGVADGTEFTYQLNLKVDDQASLQLMAEGPAKGSWNLRIPNQPGVYQCKGGPTTIPFLSLNENLTGVPRGTTHVPSNGACELKIKSVLGKIEGSFSAKLVGQLQTIHTVKEGYFVMPGYPDCGTAKDPGLAPDEKAATIAVTATAPYSVNAYHPCGSNGKLVASTAKLRDTDSTREVFFAGMLGDKPTRLLLENLYEAGTFQCGQAGSTTIIGAKKVQMRLGDSFETKKGGSCTIKVDKWTADMVEGTYEASLSFQGTGPSLTIKGTFRTPRYTGF